MAVAGAAFEVDLAAGGVHGQVGLGGGGDEADAAGWVVVVGGFVDDGGGGGVEGAVCWRAGEGAESGEYAGAALLARAGEPVVAERAVCRAAGVVCGCPAACVAPGIADETMAWRPEAVSVSQTSFAVAETNAADTGVGEEGGTGKAHV